MIVSITMVRNEADIVEPFIRHNARLLDAMVVLDNGSSDNTASILFSLIAEGLPVFYLFDADPCYSQDTIATALLRSVLEHFSPDFIFPLDVDEFLVSYDSACPRDALRRVLSSEVITLLPWTTYVPAVRSAASNDEPLSHMNLRRCIEPIEVHKAIVPASIAANHEITLKQGNHDIVCSHSERIERRVVSDPRLAHFPIRSGDQLRAKALIGWIANLAKGEYSLFDWYSFYCSFKHNAAIDDEQLAGFAIRKDLPLDASSPQVEFAPPFVLPVRRYGSDRVHSASLLLSYCEDLARLQLRSSHPLGFRRAITIDERSHTYSIQLSDDAMVKLITQSGLSTVEAIALIQIAFELPECARIAVFGANAEGLARFVALLHSHAKLKTMPHLVRADCNRATFLADDGIQCDLLIGDIANSIFHPGDGAQLLARVRNGGVAVFLSVDRCSFTRELVEVCLSPNKNWTDKALLRGMFYGRKSLRATQHV